jgi:hypothetical protein
MTSQHNKGNGLLNRGKIGLGLALVTALTGCVGYVGGGGGVVVSGPDAYVFGGGYERGRDVHDYSHRGFASRAIAHPGGGGRRR